MEDMEINMEDMEDFYNERHGQNRQVTHKSFCGIEQMTICDGPGEGCSPGISQVVLWDRADDNPCKTW